MVYRVLVVVFCHFYSMLFALLILYKCVWIPSRSEPELLLSFQFNICSAFSTLWRQFSHFTTVIPHEIGSMREEKTKCKNKLHGNLDRIHDNNLLHSNDSMPCVDIAMRFHFSVSNTNAPPPPPPVDTIESCLILNFCDECTRISLNGVQVVL